MRYTAVVIDNNAQELRNSVEILYQTGVFKKVIPFVDVEEAVSYIDDNGCDVLFTEIKLEKINGFGLGRRYGKSNLAMCFVFLTNDQSFALEAYRLNVTDFVIKPLDIEAIKRIIKKLRGKEYFETTDIEIDYKSLL